MDKETKELIREKVINILKENYYFNEEEKTLSEDYPISFNMEEFKNIQSFNKRIEYCEKNLQKIGSGSARIVYKIDDEKVLKLAKNSKGISQNEVEISHGSDYFLKDLNIVAEVFESDENDLWLEMQLAQKCNAGKFKQITGINFQEYSDYIDYYYDNVLGKSRYKKKIDDSLINIGEGNDFTNVMCEFIGNYDIPVGDLKRISSYGIVKENNREIVVLVDFGLTDDVYNTHYDKR